jgi:hypothetical protein
MVAAMVASRLGRGIVKPLLERKKCLGVEAFFSLARDARGALQ